MCEKRRKLTNFFDVGCIASRWKGESKKWQGVDRRRMYSTEGEAGYAEEVALEEEEAEKKREQEVNLVQLYQSMSREDREAYDTIKRYNREMSQLRKRGEYAAAVEVYRRMGEEGLNPNLFTYSQVLNLYAVMKRPTSAEAVWEKMLKVVEEWKERSDWTLAKGPREVTMPVVNAMVHVYCQSGNIKAALKLYEEANKRWGLKVQPATISPLLWFYAKEGDIAAVERLYFDFKLANPDFVPSVRTYTVLISMYGKAGQYHQLKRMLDEMKENGVKLDAVAVRVIVRMLITTDESITSDLILKLSEMSALEGSFPVLATDLTTKSEALTLLASMKASEVPPDVEIFNTLIPRVCTSYAEAREFVQMMENEYGLRANGATYDALLMLAATPAHRSKLNDVTELTKELQSRGILPSEATYCLLIRFYSQVGDRETAEELLAMLRSHNPKLSTKTHNAVVRMYAFGGAYHKLQAALAEAKADHVHLDSSTVDIVFQSMMRKGKYLDTANMLTHMIHTRQRVQMRHIVTLFANLLARAGNTKVHAEFYHYKKLNDMNRTFDDINENKISVSSSGGEASSSSPNQRAPSHVAGDLAIITQLHQTLSDTPGVLSKAPAEYFNHVLNAAQPNGVHAMCRVMHIALRSSLPPAPRTDVFEEFLNLLDSSSFTFADDIAAWRTKLVGEGRTSPLIQSQYYPFVKYVQSTARAPNTGSRVFKPSL